MLLEGSSQLILQIHLGDVDGCECGMMIALLNAAAGC